MRPRWRARRVRGRRDRLTAGLAALAVATAGTVLAGEVVRLARRRAKAQGTSQETVLEAAPSAALDSAKVLAEGYDEAPRGERVLFNILSGFVGGFAMFRIASYGQRGGWWPTGTIHIGDLHIHHFIPGILLSFAAGGAALVTPNEKLEALLAVPFGFGVGLTFDEAALLLELEDVYWTPEGLLSVQLSLGAIGVLGATILGLRLLRRGVRRATERDLIPAPG